MKRFSVIILLFAFITTGSAQSGREKGYASITRDLIQGQMEFLASDWMEGRATGTRGIYLASDYIASMFRSCGIQPFGDDERFFPSREEMLQGARPETRKSWFQKIAMLQYEPGELQEFAVISSSGVSKTAVNFTHKVDFQVQTGTVGASGQAPVFFAGYGLTEKDYDEYRKKEVKGKIVVILSGFPGHRDSTSAAFRKFNPGVPASSRFSPERNKIRKAEELGAAGVILVNPDANPAQGWSSNNPYPVKGAFYESDTRLSSYYDKRMTLPGDTLRGSIPVFTVTNRVANLLLQGIDLKAFERKAQENQTPDSRDLDNRLVSWNTTVSSKMITCRNVLGYIEGKNKDEYIVIGAHYDHLGKYDGWIWNGADDNASGTVGVLSLAKAFADSGEKPEKSIIFAAWTAEESGLNGSRYFVANFPSSKKLLFNLNFDMLSRNEASDTKGNQMTLMYTDFSPKIRDLSEKNIREFNLGIDVRYRSGSGGGGGSDHAPFVQAGIPAAFFFAGMHPDYHQPSDELSRINWNKMLNLIRLGFLNIWELSKSSEYLQK